jgi:ferredoxin
VYDIEAGEITVKQPQNCKNNCPACARICPAKAVIFPKYEKSPINGGLEDEEPMTVDTKAVYADALRMRLQQRRAGIPLKKDDT